ncbi:MAG: hypothetical protein K8U57_35475 [Planctomycetes bacterium]|nr:hypothetical protein [Planctomycetota bacterium]
MSLALFGWVRSYGGFVTTNGAIRDAAGGGEMRGGTHEWDRAVGLFPYAYYQLWHPMTGGSSPRWELVRVDYPRGVLTAALGLIVCGSAYAAARRAIDPKKGKPKK